MMMIGDPHHHYNNPTVYNSPWDPTVTIFPQSSSPTSHSPLSVMTTANGNSSPISSPTAKSYFPSNNHESLILKALSRYLPSNEADVTVTDVADFDAIDEGYCKSDEFRMYEFKVRGCTRPKAHDWTECPFAHPGEKAHRRDPRRYSYSGTACTDFRKGSCRRGETCEFAHGVFECWLHPTRYRTQACKDGLNCTRRVCFFAHTAGQLRVNIGPESDPIEEELVASIRSMQLSKVKSMPTRPSWKFQVGIGSPRVGSGLLRPGFYSLPTTPTRISASGYLDAWEKENEPELMMERVESGRELRSRMFEKLSKENPLSFPEPVESSTSGPDVGWVTDLVLN